MADYISKNEVLNLIMHNDKVCHYADERYENVVYATACRISDVVANMPAADVQPVRHGRWENEYLDDDDVWWADCTNCNNETHSRFGRVSMYAYCPNCSAKMIKDGEQNG